MESKSGKIIMITSGVIAAGAALWYVWKKFIDVDDEEEEEETKTTAPQQQQEEIANLPVPKKLMIKIFSEISESVEMVMMQLGKYEEQLQQNPSYTPEMVSQEIQNKFELMLTTVEEKIYEVNNVKKEDVDRASTMLENDRDFKRATYRLRTVFAVLNGQTPEAPDLPEFVTMAFTTEVMREVMSQASVVLSNIINQKMAELGITSADDFKNKVGGDEELQKSILEKYMTDLDVKRGEILDKYNIDKAILQIAMMTYQNDPSFQQALIEISSKQQKELEKLGFAM